MEVMDFWVVTPVMILYLAIQSVSDIKTKTVWTVLNNIMIFIQVGLYWLDNIIIQIRMEHFLIPFITFALLIGASEYLHWYGRGDAKAMLVMLFALRYYSPTYPDVDLFLFLLTILIANITFLGFHFILKMSARNRKPQEAYHAFFPFLMIGYTIIVLIQI